jgi:hypothetical protein
LFLSFGPKRVKFFNAFTGVNHNSMMLLNLGAGTFREVCGQRTSHSNTTPAYCFYCAAAAASQQPMRGQNRRPQVKHVAHRIAVAAAATNSQASSQP